MSNWKTNVIMKGNSFHYMIEVRKDMTIFVDGNTVRMYPNSGWITSSYQEGMICDDFSFRKRDGLSTNGRAL